MLARILFATALIVAATPAMATKRIALLIGNAAYNSAVGPLKNPLNDIDKVGNALARVGFEVTRVKDADFATILRSISRHTSRLRRAGSGAIGFFYYSGHGAMNAIDRTNYLIPVDVKNTNNVDLWDDSIRLVEIIDKLREQATNATHFVIFDACRNNLKLTNPGSKSVVQSKGFVPVRTASGMLIAFATAEGEIASDIGTDVGPYAKALAEEIQRPGIEAVSMFRNVQLRVSREIQQEPWMSFGQVPKMYLAGPPVLPPSAAKQFQNFKAFLRAKSAKHKEIGLRYKVHLDDDINGDGFLDFAVEAEPCGSGGCGWELYYYHHPGEYRLIEFDQELFVSEFNAAVFSPISTNGWRDVAGAKFATSNEANLIYIIYKWDGAAYKLSHYEYCIDAYRVTDYHSCAPVKIKRSDKFEGYRVSARPRYRVSPTAKSKVKKLNYNSEDDILGKVEGRPWYLVLNSYKGEASFVVTRYIHKR